jgi:3-isopropylmalate dehydrogenase
METVTCALDGWSEGQAEAGTRVIGVLPGEGIGPEGTAAALVVLDAVKQATSLRFEVRTGGAIGLEAKRATGSVLSSEVVNFVDSVFADGGAILSGPGAGRFVYELRSKFDLYCKFVPIKPFAALGDTGVLRPEACRNVEMLVVRENVGGLYLGEWSERRRGARLTEAQHQFQYDADQVSRIIRVAIDLATRRKGRLSVVVKRGGVPAISRLWEEQAEQLNANVGVELEVINVDNACYQIVADASRFDVIVAPNMFGDVVADTAALLLGSRGLSYSANFGEPGHAVYQTAHGSADDLAGTDRANPIGQILSLAMLLHESFGLGEVRCAIERAIEHTLAQGFRTPDISAPHCKEVGTGELAQRIADSTVIELDRSTATQARGAAARFA